ncbi:MAG TPA: hypothetical protein PL001_02580, partial [Candidatus Kryptobacter bacterium]|nr:hypothetical protein [Candidatus Kryptobacter bacterium]
MIIKLGRHGQILLNEHPAHTALKVNPFRSLEKKSAPSNKNGALMLVVYLPQLKLRVNLCTLFKI